MAGKSGTAVKLLVAIVVLAVIGYFVYDSFIPTARVAAATRGVAENIVYGVVKISPEGGNRALLSELSGTVRETVLAANRPMKEKEKLVILDTRALDIDLTERKGELDNAKTLAAQTINLETANALAAFDTAKKSGTVAQLRLDELQRAVEQAKTRQEAEQLQRDTNVQKLESAILRLEFQKERMTITAPFDGTITRPNVKVNETIPPGFVVAEIISAVRLVQAKVSGVDYSKVKVGQAARVRFSTYGDKVFHGTVKEISTSAEKETQRYLVNLELTDIPKEQLVADLEGDAEILVDKKPDAILVPLGAVSGTKVRLVVDGHVQEKAVRVGFQGASTYEIVSGVAEGDLVITDLGQSFRNGARVKTEVVAPATAK